MNETVQFKRTTINLFSSRKMDLETTWLKLKASIGWFLNVLARIPFFYLLEIVYNYTSKSDNSSCLGAIANRNVSKNGCNQSLLFLSADQEEHSLWGRDWDCMDNYVKCFCFYFTGYAFGLIGLFTELDLLLSFYGWLLQVLINYIIFSLIIEVKRTNNDDNNGVLAAEPHAFFQFFVSDNHFYSQIVAATGLSMATQQQWIKLKPLWIIALMLIIPFSFDLIFNPLQRMPLIMPYICYIFLLTYMVYLICKGLQLGVKFLKCTKEASDNLWRMVDGYGWMPVLRHHWKRMELSRVIMFLWWIKFGLKIAQQKKLNWFWTFATFGDLCATLPNLFAASLVISEISFSILFFTQNCLKGNHVNMYESNYYPGFNEGLAFFLLNLQIGITQGGSEERSLIISLVLFVTISLLVQDAFEITEPVLAVLGATYTGKLNSRHIRGLVVSLCLLFIPAFMVYTICSTFSAGTWLFVIISNSMVTMVQLFGALSIYFLFLANVHFHYGWEDLDDCVYYVNAVSKVFEFLVAVVVVFYSGWSALSGNWSIVGTGIICVHAYFNVYSRAIEGWKNFLLRRSAVRRLNSLKSATDEELQEYDDVCSICFDVMMSAKVTKCYHFFHGMCLRKWLYVQDKCPMCHTAILPED